LQQIELTWAVQVLIPKVPQEYFWVTIGQKDWIAISLLLHFVIQDFFQLPSNFAGLQAKEQTPEVGVGVGVIVGFIVGVGLTLGVTVGFTVGVGVIVGDALGVGVCAGMQQILEI